MKYVLNKDLPTFKAGTEAWLSKRGNLLTKEDNKEITMYNHSTLAKFPNILTEWFTPVEEKRKVVPDEGDKHYTINSYGDVGCMTSITCWQYQTLDQGNWRWTREEAELEVKKRAAIERVRRYLVENDLIEEDSSEQYITVHTNLVSKLVIELQPRGYSSYTPYGHIKNTDLSQFLEDCREDLIMIHS